MGAALDRVRGPAYSLPMRLPPDLPGSLPDVRRVAILMRTRDRPVLLARALGSVLSQTHQDWQLLLLNDGGDRASVDRLVERHDTDLDGRLTLIHHARSLGRLAAVNAALAALPDAAAYVALHDDDDSWHPDFLAHTTAHLLRHRDDAAVLTHWWTVQERVVEEVVCEGQRTRAGFEASGLGSSRTPARGRYPTIALLRRRSAVGPLDPASPDPADTLRALLVGEIGVIDEPLACRHRREPGGAPAYANCGTDPVSQLGDQAAVLQSQVLAGIDRDRDVHARHEALQQRLVRIEDLLLGLDRRIDALARTVAAGSLRARLGRVWHAIRHRP